MPYESRWLHAWLHAEKHERREARSRNRGGEHREMSNVTQQHGNCSTRNRRIQTQSQPGPALAVRETCRALTQLPAVVCGRSTFGDEPHEVPQMAAAVCVAPQDKHTSRGISYRITAATRRATRPARYRPQSRVRSRNQWSWRRHCRGDRRVTVEATVKATVERQSSR